MNKAIFAAGCFWGVEYQFKKAEGVKLTRVGYTGGRTLNPTYEEICAGGTGHFEAIEVTFDPSKTSYENLVRLFFEIHDFGQTDGQGPDIGEQYLSKIFYLDEEQKMTAEKVISELKNMKYGVETELLPAEEFFAAEDYHQDYYTKTGGSPYCHVKRKIF